MKVTLLCAYCGGPAEGNFSIHRDGFCEGPEIPLCDAHGSGETPTLEEIWTRIAQLRADESDRDLIRAVCQSAASFIAEIDGDSLDVAAYLEQRFAPLFVPINRRQLAVIAADARKLVRT